MRPKIDRKMEEVEEVRSLQRSLADLIIQMRPLDEIRLLLAQGAHINLPVTQGNLNLQQKIVNRLISCWFIDVQLFRRFHPLTLNDDPLLLLRCNKHADVSDRQTR